MTRQEYMTDSQRPNIFREYYGQYVTESIMQTVHRRIGVEKLLKSTDKHLNDIPLAYWDAMHNVLPRETIAQLRANGDGPSLGSSVCIFKEAARQIIESVEKIP